jgi:hypothetical protein
MAVQIAKESRVFISAEPPSGTLRDYPQRFFAPTWLLIRKIIHCKRRIRKLGCSLVTNQEDSGTLGSISGPLTLKMKVANVLAIFNISSAVAQANLSSLS